MNRARNSIPFSAWFIVFKYFKQTRSTTIYFFTFNVLCVNSNIRSTSLNACLFVVKEVWHNLTEACLFYIELSISYNSKIWQTKFRATWELTLQISGGLRLFRHFSGLSQTFLYIHVQGRILYNANTHNVFLIWVFLHFPENNTALSFLEPGPFRYLKKSIVV